MDVGVHRWLPLQSLPSLSVMQIYGYGRRPPSESALKVVFMSPMIAGEGGQRQIKTAGVRKRRRHVSASIFGARGNVHIQQPACPCMNCTQPATHFASFTWVIVSLARRISGLRLSLFCFPTFCLLADFMTHHLPVLLHLRAHICRDRIKQNGSAIKRLWHLSSHTS